MHGSKYRFSIDKTKMCIVNDLIKNCNGRYLFNPYHEHGKDTYRIGVGFDSMDDHNKFNSKLHTIKIGFTEKDNRSKFTSFINHLRYFFKNIKHTTL